MTLGKKIKIEKKKEKKKKRVIFDFDIIDNASYINV